MEKPRFPDGSKGVFIGEIVAQVGRRDGSRFLRQNLPHRSPFGAVGRTQLQTTIKGQQVQPTRLRQGGSKAD